jgi:hypothetical protein
VSRLGILSGCDRDRTLSPANHQYYAERHGYCYINDAAPEMHGRFRYKLDKISKFLNHGIFDVLFWIDDDAFFMQHDKPLTPFLDQCPGNDLIACKSPMNRDLQGREIWTYFTSGSFFVRNTPLAREFFDACRTIPIERMEEWWDESRHGLNTHGDQSIMVYLLHEDPRFNGPDFHRILPFEAFNSRTFHFTERVDQHFLLHFCGGAGSKEQQIAEFAARFGVNTAFIPEDALAGMHGLRKPALASK